MDWYIISQVHLYKGNFYSNISLNYKLTSVKSLNSKDLIGREVTYKGTKIKGKITDKVVDNNLGIHWYRGATIKEWGHPYYFNEFKKIIL